MKIATLLGSLSRNNGGVSEVARRLSQELARLPDCAVEVCGLRDEYFEADRAGWSPLQPVALESLPPRSFGYSPQLVPRLKAPDIDLIHSHGLWSYAGIAARRSGRPYLVSPHGMLDRWALANSKWKKRIAGRLFERSNLSHAKCLHAITQQERDAIRSYGVTGSICVIPNGVDLPANDPPETEAPWTRQAEGRHVLLYLGRIHPKKGLLPLIEGWHQARAASSILRSEWMLAIAGWDQGGFSDTLRQRVEELNLGRDVVFVGPQFGAAREAAYRHATAFVLPSFSEGLPLVVLEAWAHRLPVLMTAECNLPIGFERKAALPIQPAPESIAEGLRQLAESSEDHRWAMGGRGRDLVAAQFSWPALAQEMARVYHWLLGAAPPPASLG